MLLSLMDGRLTHCGLGCSDMVEDIVWVVRLAFFHNPPPLSRKGATAGLYTSSSDGVSAALPFRGGLHEEALPHLREEG